MQSIVEAYNKTSYRIAIPNEVMTLRPGYHCPSLDQFLTAGGWGSAAVITASNPRGIVLSHEDNVTANAVLRTVASEAVPANRLPVNPMDPASAPPKAGAATIKAMDRTVLSGFLPPPPPPPPCAKPSQKL